MTDHDIAPLHFYRTLSVRVYQPFLARLEALAEQAQTTPDNYVMEIIECWMDEHRPEKVNG